MLRNTAAAINVLSAAAVVEKGGGGQWHQVIGVAGSGAASSARLSTSLSAVVVK